MNVWFVRWRLFVAISFDAQLSRNKSLATSDVAAARRGFEKGVLNFAMTIRTCLHTGTNQLLRDCCVFDVDDIVRGL